jgi:SAM-dependent methyltransferase
MTVFRPARWALKGLVQLSSIGFKRGPHLTRYFMYERLPRIFAKIPERDGFQKVLSISHSRNVCEMVGLGQAEITEANYPQVNILDLPFAEESFDVVVSDQVLEHVEGNPQQAVDETRRVLKPGGVSLHTTCFMYPGHPDPKDFWRFTPAALALLHRDYAEIIEAGGWGNRLAILVENLGLRYHRIPEARWHYLNKIARKNDPRWPIMTWVAARK